MANRLLSLILAIAFLTQSVLPASAAGGSAYGGGYAQESSARLLNASGSLALITNLPVLRYLSLNPANPDNYFNFLVDNNVSLRSADGGEAIYPGNLNAESRKLINYFFLGLTLPGDAFWVNLQPNQADKLTSSELAKTDLGRVLLQQDLRLKKDMANHLSPKNEIGKQFWTALYQKIGSEGRKTNITTNNRVWIVPEKAVVVETEDGALVTEAKLKVMLESEYFEHLRGGQDSSEVDKVKNDQIQQISESLMKEIIIPAITKDVNESVGYAPLRQIYHSLILAQYFKKRNNEITQKPNNPYASYLNSGKTAGLESSAPWSKDAIYQDYLKSYAQGEYKFIDKTIFNLKRMYFSGGVILDLGSSPVMEIISNNRKLTEAMNPSEINNNSSPLLVEGSIVNGKIVTKIITMLKGFLSEKNNNKYQSVEEKKQNNGMGVENKNLKVEERDKVIFKIDGDEYEGIVSGVRDGSSGKEYVIKFDESSEPLPIYVKQAEIVKVLDGQEGITSSPINLSKNAKYAIVGTVGFLGLLWAGGGQLTKAAKDNFKVKTEAVNIVRSGNAPELKFIEDVNKLFINIPPLDDGVRVALLEKILPVEAKIKEHKEHIIKTAQRYNIPAYMLASVIGTEMLDMDDFENITDAAGALITGKTSIGLTQMKPGTARMLYSELKEASDQKIALLLEDEKFSIDAAGRYLKYLSIKLKVKTDSLGKFSERDELRVCGAYTSSIKHVENGVRFNPPFDSNYAQKELPAYQAALYAYFAREVRHLAEPILNGPASSPVGTKGGIDLNNIELTLKDEKFISNLNPADYKILLAAKALKEGSSPLSLLRLHEAMGLLKSDIVKSIRNKGLLIQLLAQLQSHQSLDPRGMQFLHFIQKHV